MTFGIVVCPNCKKAKGVDLSKKTTKCIRCKKKLEINKLKIFYKTESREKLSNVLGLLNAELDGKIEDFKKLIRSE